MEPWYHIAKAVAVEPVRGWFRLRYEGLEHIPITGPAIVACNHISYLDPLTNAAAICKAGRRPRFLAKDDLFRIPVVGSAIRGARQIPVARGSRDAVSVLRAAEGALAQGEVVVIYPEGTVTRRPDHLPMDGKTGVVRLSLATGVPITPLASWGSQAVWQKSKGSLKFGRPVFMRVGPPIDPSSRGAEVRDAAALRAMTAEFMAAITVMVEELRCAYPKRWSEDG